MSMFNPNNWFNEKNNTHSNSSTRSQRRPALPQNSSGNYDNSNGHYYNHAPDTSQHRPRTRSYQSHRNCNRHHNKVTKQYRGSTQTQTQRYATRSDQTQKTADMQMFKEQVNNTFISVEQAAKMSQDPKWDDRIVNSATDGAVLTLDMFAITCGEFCKQADKDALDLAKKTVYDKWNALKLKDEQTFHLTTKYRDFLIAALNGNKNLRFKSYRVASSELDKSAESELENNPRALHDTYQHLITNAQQFNAQQLKNRSTPTITKKYKKMHEEELKQFRGNKRYRNQDTLHTQNGHYEKPKQEQFYFTKSGQNASFEGLNSKAKKKEAQREMEKDIHGDVDMEKKEENAYRKIPKDLVYPNNAVLLLSRKNKLGECSKPIPCKVLYPKSKKKVFKRIVVEPAFPFDDSRMQYAARMLCFDVNKVKRAEDKHIRTYGKLGYDSITEIDNAIHSAMNLDRDFE